MKKVQVSGKCNGCGLCLIMNKYVEENADGNAIAKQGVAVEPKDLNELKKICEKCPQGALNIVESSNTSKSGKEGIRDLKNVLEKRARETFLRKIEKKDVSFHSSEYEIAVPYSPKQYSYVYNSESQAKAAARDEFERLCYSTSAYRPILKKIFVEYKLRKIRPYYGTSISDDSVYRKFNYEMESFLKNIYVEAKVLNGGKTALPESWCSFDVYLPSNDMLIKMLAEYEENSTCSGIMEEFKSNGEYTRLSWYVNQMDYDYEEMYDGEGLFGRTKYKNKWNFTGFESAAKEFISDLKSAMDGVNDDIERRAQELINAAIDMYNKKAQTEFLKKIQEFSKAYSL